MDRPSKPIQVPSSLVLKNGGNHGKHEDARLEKKDSLDILVLQILETIISESCLVGAMRTTSPSLEISYSSWKCFFFERWRGRQFTEDQFKQAANHDMHCSQTYRRNISHLSQGYLGL